MSSGVMLGLIVEGHGDDTAVPFLIRRILSELAPELKLALLRPYRVKRQQIEKEEEFNKALEFVARRTGSGGRILVLFDADDGLPCVLGPKLQGWALKHRQDVKVEIAIAQRTYEAWFLASAVALRGKCGLPEDLVAPPSPDEVPSPKGWVKERMKSKGKVYKETVDQPRLTSHMSVNEARRSKSFNKLLTKLGRLFDVPIPPPT
jgi:hypothetical protein